MLAELIRSNQPCVALTGAGTSTESGIPDFRSASSGIWAQFDPYEVASIDGFHRDPERVWDFYRRRLGLLEDAQPNAAHIALAKFWPYFVCSLSLLKLQADFFMLRRGRAFRMP